MNEDVSEMTPTSSPRPPLHQSPNHPTSQQTRSRRVLTGVASKRNGRHEGSEWAAFAIRTAGRIFRRTQSRVEQETVMMERDRRGELPIAVAATPRPRRNPVTQCSRGKAMIMVNARVTIGLAGRRTGITNLREWRLGVPIGCSPLRYPGVRMLRPGAASGV